jgi:hypothetical protein
LDAYFHTKDSASEKEIGHFSWEQDKQYDKIAEDARYLEFANDRKWNDARIVIHPEQMKQIARYELTFDKIVEDASEKDDSIVFPEVYSYTLKDLKQAFMNTQKADPTIFEFCRNWFYPIKVMGEAFNFSSTDGLLEDKNGTPEYMKEYECAIPISDSAYFKEIWRYLRLKFMGDLEEEDRKVSEVIEFDALINDIERHMQNKGKSLEEWVFSRKEKEKYICRFGYDDWVKNPTENQLVLCRRFVDELCNEDSKDALRIKGYACYGGNRLYPCDWGTARDCITRLYDQENNPFDANTLGYIYYYGYCNGGVPEYDKAFYYFGIAAACCVRQSMYKLADMYWHGYGCKKNTQIALNLYRKVYGDSYDEFLEGQEANFADAALRMGNVYAKGTGVKEDPDKAYYFYLQADYASKLRMKNSVFFGNKTVAVNIQNAIEEIKTKLPKDYFKDKMIYDIPFDFEKLAGGGKRCKLKRSKDADGNIVLTATRVVTQENRKREYNPEYVLVTAPEIQYCERRMDISYILIKPSYVWFKKGYRYVKYDFCEMNKNKNRYEFYYDYKLVAYVECGEYQLLTTIAEYRFASIMFDNDDRTYDYICDIEDVHVGDTVTVAGFGHEEEVTVAKITTRRESELSRLVEQYPKIIRKVK